MARALLLTIVCCINRQTNELSMSLNQLAEETCMGVDTVIKWTAALEKDGYLKVKRSKGGKHNDVNIYSLAGAAAEVGLWNRPLENSESLRDEDEHNPSNISRAGVDNSERFLNKDSNESSDDDEKLPSGDSGEFALEKEGRDESQQRHDASRKYLEERGVKDPALAEASKHPLSNIERAFAVAEAKQALDKPAYALTVLKNGEYKSPPPWMRPDYKPIGSLGNSSAVKTSFQKSSWSEFVEEAAPANG
jgi:hypothetical protein